MNYLEFSLLVCAGSALAGFLGALTGLGGGVVIIPMLTLLFHVDIRYAMGASLISVIATSSGAAAAYVKEGFSNIRIAMFLELATTVGAVVGAAVTARLDAAHVAALLGVVLIYSAIAGHHSHTVNATSDRLGVALRLGGVYPSLNGPVTYGARHVPGGFAVMFAAGALSGLLGIGSGAVKVLGMDRIMQLPLKVSTTTSNFMIGVTAAAGAGVYLRHGYVDPHLAAPVMLGVLAGSAVAAPVLARTESAKLRWVFRVVVLVLGLQMLIKGVRGDM